MFFANVFLGVEQIVLRRPAPHEQEDHPFGPRDRSRNARIDVGSRLEHVRERQRAKPASRRLQHLATADRKNSVHGLSLVLMEMMSSILVRSGT